jgi:hypothetical protein
MFKRAMSNIKSCETLEHVLKNEKEHSVKCTRSISKRSIEKKRKNSIKNWLLMSLHKLNSFPIPVNHFTKSPHDWNFQDDHF